LSQDTRSKRVRRTKTPAEARSCQWEGCAGTATKHVIYNYQEEGATETDDGGLEIDFSLTHADLCDSHEAELREQHDDVHLEEGECTFDCPLRA
jgi:hypothetical protein